MTGARDMSGWVKGFGMAALVLVIVIIILDKFQGIVGAGTANTTITAILNVLGDIPDLLEIGLYILVGVFFFKQLASSKMGGGE